MRFNTMAAPDGIIQFYPGIFFLQTLLYTAHYYEKANLVNAPFINGSVIRRSLLL